MDTAVIGGFSGYDTRRTALENTARGDTVGGDLNVLVAAGYDWKKGSLSIGPTASFQYTLVGFDDFAESGSLTPLVYPSQNAESFRTAFGMKTSYDWKIGPIHLINLGTGKVRVFGSKHRSLARLMFRGIAFRRRMCC